MRLIVVCVNAGNYMGEGQYYVESLYKQVKRYLSRPHEFWCFTDDSADYVPGIIKKSLPRPDLTGWWHKLSLFAPGVMPEDARVLYFDIDTLIKGSIDDIAAYDGQHARLGPFFDNVTPVYGGPQSGVMAWPGGWGEHIWQTYVNTEFPTLPGGDQKFLNHVEPHPDILQAIYPGKIVSFRREGGLIPAEASVVCFHGVPTMRQVFPDGWEFVTSTETDADMKRIGGYWWPINDKECWRSCLALADDSIDKALKWTSGRRTCVQAGANAGVYPKRFASTFEKVVAFEPDPANLKCLERNVSERNVVMIDKALSNCAVNLTIISNPENSGQSHIQHSDDSSENVQSLRLDDLGLDDCDLIYLDVEGFEKTALEGAVETINQCRPTICIEENGLSERYGVQNGETTIWLAKNFNYKVAEQYQRDVFLVPREKYDQSGKSALAA